jgi:excisionase family DNA binding protein
MFQFLADVPEVISAKHIRGLLGCGRRQSYEYLHHPAFDQARIKGNPNGLSKSKFIQLFGKPNWRQRNVSVNHFSFLDRYPDIMTVNQILEILPCSRDTILRKLHNKEIPYIQTGKKHKCFVLKEHLRSYLENDLFAA